MANLSRELKGELDRTIQAGLKEILAMGGTRQELRQKWLEKYRAETPTFEEAVTGGWPRPPQPGTSKGDVAAQSRLVITSIPESCDLYINDKYFGTTPTAELVWPLLGRAEVRVAKSGYKDFKREITFNTPNTYRIKAELEPLAGK